MEDASIGLNDSIAHAVMKRNRLREIYSFDKDFDGFADLIGLTQ
jgi:predicted nucleic acid-binding protein